MISDYAVTGMSCEHCVGRVCDELSQLAGVSHVEVELATGMVSVTSELPLSRHDVENAVDEAGYELASS